MDRDRHIDQLLVAYTAFSQDKKKLVVKLENSGGAVVVFGANGQSRGEFSIDNYGNYSTHDELARLVRAVIARGAARL